MIPIGTLCEIIEAPPSQPELLSRLCTVIGHANSYEGITHVLHIPSDPGAVGLEAWVCKEYCLRPIVPPGSPDRVAALEREPVELLR